MDPHRQAPRTLKRDASAAAAADLGALARTLARRVTLAYDRALATVQLGGAQFSLLCLIAAARDDTIGALAAAAGVNQSTMSRNVDQLVAAGLAEVVSTEHDRRRRAVWLTEAGARRLAAALPLWRAASAQLEQALGPDLPARLADGARALQALDPAAD